MFRCDIVLSSIDLLLLFSPNDAAKTAAEHVKAQRERRDESVGKGAKPDSNVNTLPFSGGLEMAELGRGCVC